MSALIPQTTEGVNRLLDNLKANGGLKNDAALSRALDVAAPVISNLRKGRLPLGATILLHMYDTFDMSIREMKSLAAGAVDEAAQ